MGLLRVFKCNVNTARDNLKMNWPIFNIQRPFLRSHCELYIVIKKAGRAPKQMDMKQTLDNNIFIEAKTEAHKINDYICKTGLTAIFWRWRTVRSRGFQGDRNSHKEFQAKNQKETNDVLILRFISISEHYKPEIRGERVVCMLPLLHS